MATISVNESRTRLDDFMDEMLYRIECLGLRPAHVGPRNEDEHLAWEAQLERGRKIAERNDTARIGEEVADELERIGRKAV